MKLLVTGAAGFIGYHVSKRLCERGDDVLGIDNLNDYYDVSLKNARLRELEPFTSTDDRRLTTDDKKCGRFTFKKMDVADQEAMESLFAEHHFDRVIHLAAQAGVRYSLENPHAYVRSNVVGFLNVLESCRQQWGVTDDRRLTTDDRRPTTDDRRLTTDDCSGHLVYASSSSVYGSNTKLPFSVTDNVDHPISLYGATKRSDELMAYTYSHLYGIPTTGLRFFTVYGPWGRPDMAYFKFTKAILAGDPIDVYNEGRMQRDFTYIDDIVEGVLRVCDHVPLRCKEGAGGGRPSAETGVPDDRRPTTDDWRLATDDSRVPYKLYNIGNHSPVQLTDFIKAIEQALGKKAVINYKPMQPGDVPATYADVDDLMHDVGFKPSTPIKNGIARFVDWYQQYYA